MTVSLDTLPLHPIQHLTYPRRARPTERFHVVLVLLWIALLAGCDVTSEMSALQHIEKAREYIAVSDPNAAVIELKNALQKDPNLGEGRYLLGDLYMKLGMAPAAEVELLNARSRGYQADNLDTLILGSYLMQGKFQQILDQTSMPESDIPLTPATLILRGSAQLGMKENDGAEASFLEALRSDNKSVEARLGLATLALERNETGEAIRLVDEASGLAPEHPEVLQLRAEIAIRGGNYAAAERDYRQAASLAQFNIPAQLGLIRVLVEQDKIEEAKAPLSDVQARFPDHPITKYYSALIALHENDPELAKIRLTEVLGILPNHSESQLLMANLFFNEGRFEQARDYITKFLSQNSGNLAARRLLATVLLSLGETAQAIRQLEDTISVAGETPELLGLLASAYRSAGDADKAKALLQQAMSASPDDALIGTQLASTYLSEGNVAEAVTELEFAIRNEPELTQPRMLMVITHLRDGQYDAAISAAQQVVSLAPQNPASYNLLGTAYFASNDTDLAREQFERALSINASYEPALYNLARLELARDQPEGAETYYQRILSLNPTHLQTLMDMARINLERGDTATMVEWLERARSSDVNAAGPRMLLGRHYLMTGDFAKALELAREAYALVPTNVDSRLQLAQSSRLMGDVDGALSILTSLKTEQPESVIVLYELALCRLHMADNTTSQDLLEQVLKLAPDHIGALTISTQLALRLNNTELARTYTARLAKLQPDSMLSHSLIGDTYLTERRYAEAIGAYEKAYAVSQEFAQAAKLSQAHDVAGEKEQALNVLFEWLAQNPDDARAHRMLAAFSLRDGDFNSARTHYEAALARLPDDDTVLNNLGWLLIETDPVRAEELTRHALKLSPDDGQIMDTLGWILVRQGKHEQGLSLLRRAQARYPDSLDVRYHIAYALAASGEKERAITELDAILAMDTDFFQRDEAEELLTSLRR